MPDVEEIRIEPQGLKALLGVPGKSRGIVIFAHGSGSGRLSPRNNHVASALRQKGLATLLLDLLTPAEEQDRRNVFNIGLLASRLALATRWCSGEARLARLMPLYFGASTGAAAAFVAAACPDLAVAAIVSRGGRPDLAMDILPAVRAPSLLLVGSLDTPVIAMNERALAALNVEKKLLLIEGGGHLFEEPGTLDEVIRHAAHWFLGHLPSQQSAGPAA
jgi:dienelactone hydrolase